MANQRGQTPHSTIYVSFSAGINVNTTESLIAVMADCIKKRAAVVYLLFSSEGGSVMHGINLGGDWYLVGCENHPYNISANPTSPSSSSRKSARRGPPLG